MIFRRTYRTHRIEQNVFLRYDRCDELNAGTRCEYIDQEKTDDVASSSTWVVGVIVSLLLVVLLAMIAVVVLYKQGFVTLLSLQPR